MEIAVIVGIALVVLCIVVLCYVSSNSYFCSTSKEKRPIEAIPDWPDYSTPQHPVGIFRIFPYLNKETLEPEYQVQRCVNSSTFSKHPFYDWSCWFDRDKRIIKFSSETEAQLFIDSYLETERILKQKELQYQEFMKNNPPKIYPKVIDEQDTGAIPRDYS